jgi:hypothetical protein
MVPSGHCIPRAATPMAVGQIHGRRTRQGARAEAELSRTMVPSCKGPAGLGLYSGNTDASIAYEPFPGGKLRVYAPPMSNPN